MASRDDISGRPKDAATAAATPKVMWDDSKMNSVYANVCNVSSTREEVVLMFGVNQAWQGAQSEVTVTLSDRVILSPFAAKRLSILLQQIVSQYETRFGALEVLAQPQRAQAEAAKA